MFTASLNIWYCVRKKAVDHVVDLVRLRAKWPQMETFYWAKLKEVENENEREDSKALHLLWYLRKASKAICDCVFCLISFVPQLWRSSGPCRAIA